MTASIEQTTQILAELADGDDSAAERLLPLVYEELRGLAAGHLLRESPGHTLQATALVHEVYLKMVEQSRVDWKNRAHFFSVAAQALRRILVDHARRRNAQKRGSDWNRVTLGGLEPAGTWNPDDLLALDHALTRLQALDERQHQVVQLRFFAGLSEKEAAYLLDVSRTTVADDWAVAKAWLASEVRGSKPT